MTGLTPEELEQLAIAEAIVSSEAFMWLMVGSNHTELQLRSLEPAYREWCKRSGGFVMSAKYNRLRQRLQEELPRD